MIKRLKVNLKFNSKSKLFFVFLSLSSFSYSTPIAIDLSPVVDSLLNVGTSLIPLFVLVLSFAILKSILEKRGRVTKDIGKNVSFASHYSKIENKKKQDHPLSKKNLCSFRKQTRSFQKNRKKLKSKVANKTSSFKSINSQNSGGYKSSRRALSYKGK